MPNWCQNNLRVWGNVDELAEFKSKSLVDSLHNSPEDFDFTMEGLFPTPEELLNDENPPVQIENESPIDRDKRLKQRVEDYGFNNWYDWRIHNWGTKWDAAETYITENSEEELYISFDTAWGPPSEWVKRVSIKFPNLNFTLDYMEEGQSICGIIRIGDGEITEEDGEPRYLHPENEEEVVVDEVTGGWIYAKSKERIEDPDFYPIAENPFIF